MKMSTSVGWPPAGDITINMMNKYEILVDMSVDIDPEKAKLYDVKYIPMEVRLGDSSEIVDRPRSKEEMHIYYDLLRQGIPTGTSQVTPFDFEEAFGPYVEKGQGVLYIALSSGLSNTYQSALMAVEALRERYGEAKVEIEVVDSLGATCGQGMLCEAAGINRADGLTLSENAAWLRRNRLRVHYWFKVEDLMYLCRGGRVSGAAALVGTALSIKPVLTILPDGKLDTVAKKRGSRLAIKYLAEIYKEYRECGVTEGSAERAEHLEALYERVYVLGTDSPDTEELRKLALAVHPGADISITSVSPVIGAHTGPDMTAIVFWGKDRG